MNIKTKILFFFYLIRCVFADEYLDEVKNKCLNTRRLLYCGKFNLLKSIQEFEYDSNTTDIYFNKAGSVHLIKIPKEGFDINLYPSTRQFADDGELVKFYKFLQRKLVTFLSNHGLILNLPPGSRLIDASDDGESIPEISGEVGRAARNATGRLTKRQKKLLIIPILLLFKMFKVKVLLAFALAGIIFIKKVMLMVALMLPAMFASLKAHCRKDDDRGYYDYHHPPPHEEGGVFGFLLNKLKEKSFDESENSGIQPYDYPLPNDT